LSGFALKRLKKAQTGQSRWIFEPQFAERPIILARQLNNIKGPEAGRPLDLLAFQHWIIINLYGFVDQMGGTRRFRQGAIWLPKGNGLESVRSLHPLRAKRAWDGFCSADYIRAGEIHEPADPDSSCEAYLLDA
jgi:hypothetical protein